MTSKLICPCDPEHSPGTCDELCCPGGIYRRGNSPCDNFGKMTITFDQAAAFVDLVHKGEPGANAFQLLTGFFCPALVDFTFPLQTRNSNRRKFIAFLRAVADALEAVKTT